MRDGCRIKCMHCTVTLTPQWDVLACLMLMIVIHDVKSHTEVEERGTDKGYRINETGTRNNETRRNHAKS